jgi:quercetin dioxygenase-like cupin family protein
VTRALIAAAACAACAACGHKAPPPETPTTHERPPSAKQQIEGDDPEGDRAKADAAAQDDARIAAIQQAMNTLSPVANQCWAAAAAGDFHVAGEVKMRIVFDDAGRATAKPDEDTTKNAILTDCLARVLVAYAWPAGLMASQEIELPFQFTAPTGQNTIDRRLVQNVMIKDAPAEIAVLLDAANTGNAAASMIELDLDPGGAVPAAPADRDEVWIFLDAAKLTGSGSAGKPRPVAALDAAYAPKGSSIGATAPDGAAARVVIVFVPGGDEHLLRDGEHVERGAVTASKQPAELHPHAKAKRYPRTGGATTILVENAPHKASAGVIELDAAAKVPQHVHEHETELLYVLSGSGTLTVDGVDMPVGPTTVVQIPPNVPHSFVAAEALTALQLYTPPGPEQRFKKMK